MKHMRIHIFGASGSGTTTLGRELSSRLGIVHLDTDDYYWFPTDPPFTAKRPIAERIELLKNELADRVFRFISSMSQIR